MDLIQTNIINANLRMSFFFKFIYLYCTHSTDREKKWFTLYAVATLEWMEPQGKANN